METQFYVWDEITKKYTGQYFSIQKTLVNSTEIVPISDFCQWNGVEWVVLSPENIECPLAVSKRQLKQALVIAGIPLSNIESAIADIQIPLEKELMQIFWNDSTEFERNHPKLIEFSQALEMTETQVDQLFIMASNL